MAHFHYTIMGGLIFAFMAGLYYWLPKMMGIKLNPTLGKWQFWIMFIAFNSTFLPLFAVGMAGQPRRVFEYARNLPAAQRLGVDLLVLPRRLDPALRDQLRLVDGVRARARGRQPVAVARAGVAGRLAAAARQLRPRSRSSCPARTTTGSGTRSRSPTCIRRPECSPRRSHSQPQSERRHSHGRDNGPAASGADAGGGGGGLLPRVRAERLVDWRQAGAGRDVVPVRRVRVRLLLPEVAQQPRPLVHRAESRPQAWAGVVVAALVVVSAAVQTLALQRIKAGNKSAWQAGALVALVLGLAAVAIQIWQLAEPALLAGRQRVRQRLRRLLPGLPDGRRSASWSGWRS